MILPATFDSDDQFRISQAALGIFSVALLAAGFCLDGLVCFACRNWIFQVECVYSPSLTSCIIGLLTVFYSFIISKRYVWNVAALLVTIGSALSIIVYAALLVLALRRIAALRKHGERLTPLVAQPNSTSSPSLTYHHPTYFDNHLANMYPASRTAHAQVPHDPPEELTEDDLMRQQMLMLLVNKPEAPISPDPAASTFNRIDFNPMDEPESAHPPQMSGPGYYGYYAPSTAGHSSQQSWGGSTLQPWDGVWRSGPLPNKAIREQRRREIEQGR